MKRVPTIVGLTVALVFLAAPLGAEEPDTAVIYVNGIFASELASRNAATELQRRLASESGIEFTYVYNQSGCPGLTGCLADILEAVQMAIESDFSQFLAFLAGFDPFPEFFQEALQDIAASFDAGLITNDDRRGLNDELDTKFLQGKKIVVVAHSQGNFLANQAYPSPASGRQDSFGIVSAANPDSFVEGDDRPFFDDHHTTLFEDIIIDCLILDCVPGAELFNPMFPNRTNIILGVNFRDLSGHRFLPSYLRESSNSESKILSDILDVRGLLVQPPFGVEFIPSASGSGRAVAFDPATGKVYYTLRGLTDIFITDASNSPAGAISPGITFGALAWDANRGVLWGGGYQFGELGNIYQITPAGVKTFQFHFTPAGGNCYDQTPGFIDGLAYDESDDTLWISDDASFEIHHVDLNGNLLGSFAVPPNPRSGRQGCNTGIAVDGDFLWLALQSGPDQAPHDIAKVAKSNPSRVLTSFPFSSSNVPGPEDIELDLTTVPGTAALWSNQFGTPNVLKLWKLRSTGMM